MAHEEKYRRLEELRAQTKAGGGEAAVERQHKRGKLTARERVDLLVDPGTFVEIDKPFVTPSCSEFGMEDQKQLPGRRCRHRTRLASTAGRSSLFAQDFTVFGGSLSGANAEKICKIMDMAMKVGAPIDRTERRRRRAHPRRRRLARRVRRYLPAQHPRSRASCRRSRRSWGHARAARSTPPPSPTSSSWWRGHEPHVRDGTERRQDGDARGGHAGRAGRCPGARFRSPASLTSSRRRRRRARSRRSKRTLLSFLPQNNTEDAAGGSNRRTTRTAWTRPCGALVPRRPQQAVRHEGPHPSARRRRRRTSWRSTSTLPRQHRRRLRSLSVAASVGVIGNQPAVPGRLPRRRRRSQEGRALRALLRRLQHPAHHLRGRARLPCPASTRSGAASSSTARSSSTPTVKPPFPKLTVITRKAYGGAYDVMSSQAHPRRRGTWPGRRPRSR